MAETPEQTGMEHCDPALCDDLIDTTQSSAIGSEMDHPATSAKSSIELSEHNLEYSPNESRTTVGQAHSQDQLVGPSTPSGSSPTQAVAPSALRYSNPSSRRKSLSQRLRDRPRVLHDEQTQEQRTIDYLQANGLELASARGRAHLEPSPNNSKSSLSKVERIARILNGIKTPESDPHVSSTLIPAPQSDVNDSETRRRSLSRTRRVLHRIKAHRQNDRPGGDDLSASVTDQTLPEQSHTFQTRRLHEGANWYSGSRAAKTLPSGFEPPEGLQESLGANKRGSLRARSSTSASLRLRNYRLPPAYVLPSEQTALMLGSVHVPNCRVAGDDMPSSSLSVCQSLGSVSGGQSAAPMISDSDENDESVPAPLNIPRRPTHDLTIHASIIGERSGPEQGSNRGSRFSEIMEESDPGAIPVVPPKNPDRASGRNSALLSNRASAVSPIPQPVPEVVPPAVHAKEHKEIPWTSFGIIVLVWLTVTALTLFGISRISPLGSYAPACTLEQVHTCASPSLSFKHSLRLNITLPSSLRPYLASLQLNDIEDQILTDRGIEVSAVDPTSRVKVQGGLAFETFVSGDGISLLSDITYAGVIDGDGDDEDDKSKLGAMMKHDSCESKRKIMKVVSAHDRSHTNSVGPNKALREQLFVGLCLGCMLAAELALFCYFVLLPVLGAGIMLLWSDWLSRGRDAVERRGFWKHEVAIVSRLAILCVLAGALGTVGASGILVAFWT